MYAFRKNVDRVKFTLEAAERGTRKVKFYTGMTSFIVLTSLLTLVGKHVAHNSQNALTEFEEMMLLFMRLRLNLHVQDLAYRFGV